MAIRVDASGSVGVIGTGFIGCSLSLALRQAGRTVRGYDRDHTQLELALELGHLDGASTSVADLVGQVEVVFVAVPVSGIADVVCAALDAGAPAVSDVGSVKGPVVLAVEAARPVAARRFVGGHPMAGSERDGPEGARKDLFAGTTWVLTPTPSTDPGAFAAIRSLVAATAAEVVAVEPDLHDDLVAIVSHVPHLAAASLLQLAASAGPAQDVLSRLAAGGFRTLTRVASSNPGIWPDICAENREAILEALDRYLAELRRVRDLVAGAERSALLEFLERARVARQRLPSAAQARGGLVELRILVADRPGVLAEVTTLAGRNGVNIVDLEIAHGAEGGGGVLLMTVPAAGARQIKEGLQSLGFRLTSRDVR